MKKNSSIYLFTTKIHETLEVNNVYLFGVEILLGGKHMIIRGKTPKKITGL